MRDPILLLPFSLVAIVPEDANFWERMVERWGIGLVGLGLFWLLARWTMKREEAAQAHRDEEAKKQQAARDARDALDMAERKTLAERNIELQEAQLKTMLEHAAKLERLVQEGNKATADHASALRMMMLKMKRPCVNYEEFPELPDHESHTGARTH